LSVESAVDSLKLFDSGAALRSLEAAAQQAWRFHVEEATIADVHRAVRAKQITAEVLGPKLNKCTAARGQT
jgi:hypothetical protein